MGVVELTHQLYIVCVKQFFDGMEHSFLNARIVDRVDIPKRHPLDRGFVVQESNAVFYRKNLGDATVMMCDYIDEDELHPYRTSGRIRKDISVGYVKDFKAAYTALRSPILMCLFLCQLQDRAEPACERRRLVERGHEALLVHQEPLWEEAADARDPAGDLDARHPLGPGCALVHHPKAAVER